MTKREKNENKRAKVKKLGIQLRHSLLENFLRSEFLF